MAKGTTATEEDVGILHKLITELYTIKLKSVKHQVDELDILDVSELINVRDISAIAKFVEQNGITAIPAADDENSELNQGLREIKRIQSGRVLPFTGTDED